MSDETNDSPAFRLRPRRAEPKSYYTVRLEYSANPAAFTRERPRLVGAKRRAPSQRSSAPGSSYSRTKQTKTGGYNYGHLVQTTAGLPQVPKQAVVTKEDLERENRRKQLQREIAESITQDTMISPFMERIQASELEADSVYEENYISLKIKHVDHTNEKKHLVCRCHTMDIDEESPVLYVNVHLHGDYASTSLLKNGKIINIGKFKTGPARPTRGGGGDMIGDISEISDNDWVGFDVIVKYDEQRKTSNLSPLIPFVSITDMIEKPTEPFVEMAPPSPQSAATQLNVPNLPQRVETNRRLDDASDTKHHMNNDNDNLSDTDYDDEVDEEENDDDKTGECNDLDENNHHESGTKVKFPASASTAV